MWRSLCTHPIVIILVVAVAASLMQRLSDQLRRRSLRSPQDTSASISAFVVVSRGTACEPIVREILTRAARPHCLRLCVVKALHPTESAPELAPLQRASVALALSRSRDFDEAAARLAAFARNYADERFVCYLPADAQVADGWDVSLQRMLAQAPSQLPVLTARPGKGATFLRGKEMRDGYVVNESAALAEEGGKPVPALLFSSALMFTFGEVAKWLPPSSAVRLGVQDGLIGRSLWCNGADFYHPPRAVVVSTTESPTVGPARKITEYAPAQTRRTVEEYDVFVGIRPRGRGLSRRTKLGLTPRSSAFERHAKYGTDDPDLLTF